MAGVCVSVYNICTFAGVHAGLQLLVFFFVFLFFEGKERELILFFRFF